ncbi:hypothetical protein [Arcanobacterium hippocoleae]|uniref:hypothetical protein n=1 Tax=Arcanobacterium hippocoleae TaxID=149017 RepID=UPI0033417A03
MKAAVDKTIEKMIADGSWQKLMTKQWHWLKASASQSNQSRKKSAVNTAAKPKFQAKL